MENNKKNKELQSRREFFKKAKTIALPIFAVAVLATNPVVTNAAETTVSGCGMSCKGTCLGSCRGGCGTSCKGSCKTTCRGGCKNSACKAVAKN